MDELEFYNGSNTGLAIDQCIDRIKATPQPTVNPRAIPCVWKNAVSVTGSAGQTKTFEWIPGPEPGDVVFPFWPSAGTMLSVQFDHPELLDFADIDWTGGSVHFRAAGTVAITYLMADNPNKLSNF